MAATWRVVILRDAEKVLRRLPRPLQQRLGAEIDALASNPRPQSCKKLKGYDDLYRVRVGDWRIIYAVRDAQLLIVVVEVGPRSGVYQNLDQ